MRLVRSFCNAAIYNGLSKQLPRPRSIIQSPIRYASSTSSAVSAIRGTSQHSDLPSFIEYAQRVDLDRKSAVFIGTRYEYVVQDSLRRLGLDLRRVGGRMDQGADLLGVWRLPTLPQDSPLPVVVQCKFKVTKLVPSVVRELAGTVDQEPMSSKDSKNKMGILVTTREATKGLMEAMVNYNKHPMVYALMDAEDGKLHQLLWNAAASKAGLESMGLAVRHTPTPAEAEAAESQTRKDLVFTWKEEPFDGLAAVHDSQS